MGFENAGGQSFLPPENNGDHVVPGEFPPGPAETGFEGSMPFPTYGYGKEEQPPVPKEPVNPSKPGELPQREPGKSTKPEGDPISLPHTK